jgi:hypothetical protein
MGLLLSAGTSRADTGTGVQKEMLLQSQSSQEGTPHAAYLSHRRN